MTYLRRRPETHLFIIWSEARRHEPEILSDLSAHFVILEVIEVRWTLGATFARNLTRMYGDALPPNSEKEIVCGNGPFLAVVVKDPNPRYRLRRTRRGVKFPNANIFDARRRYRDLTGGGFRVHASVSPEESERNLVLLFGKHSNTYEEGRSESSPMRTQAADPVGTHGWASVEQLVDVLRVHGGDVVQMDRTGGELVFAASDLWWAEHIAGGRHIDAGGLVVQAGGRQVHLTLIEDSRTRRLLRVLKQQHPRTDSSPAMSDIVPVVRSAMGPISRVEWLYPRPLTTAAVGAVAVVTTFVGRALLPPTSRPSATWVLPASGATYAIIRVAKHSGYSKAFKHSILDRFGGDVDDAQTWLLGTLGGGASLYVLHAARRVYRPEASRARSRVGLN
jgi:hypothetical protein